MVTCLFFAESKEVAGTKQSVFELSAPVTVAEFKTLYLLSRFPLLEPLLRNALFAINLEYVSREEEGERQLISDCELAILPPVSGG